MRRLLPLFALCLLLIFTSGCIVGPPGGHAHHGTALSACPPPVAFGSCRSVDPYCLANPGRYAEPMHPVIGTNGSPYLLPQSGLKAIVTAPSQPPASLPE